MDINDALIDKLSDLAKLDFEEADRVQIKKDLSNILQFVDALNRVDTSSVEPLIFMSHEVNVLREDVVHQDISHEDALKNAPARDSDYFRVPKFLAK